MMDFCCSVSSQDVLARIIASVRIRDRIVILLSETIWLSFWFAQPEKFKKVACSEVPIVGYPAFAGGTYPVG